jgi:predicted dehydrogenase
MDLAVHHIDLALMLSGSQPVSVFAGTRDIHSQEDTVDLTIGLKSGASVQIIASYAAGLGVNRLVVTGTKGQLAIDILDPGPLRTVSGKPAFSRIGRLRAHFRSFAPLKVVRQATGEPSFQKALQLFENACNSRNTSVLPDIGAGLEAMRVAQGAQKSAVCGDRVALSVAGEVSRGA